MPVDTHLKWSEIRDFTGGYWEVNSQLIPPNGAQTMQDCYPVKEGGLRAWFKPTTFTTTGIDSVADETPKALFAHERLTNRSGNGTGTDYYLITYARAATTVKVYRMDGTNAAVVWTKIKTHAAGLEPTSPVICCNYVLSSGERYFVYALGAAGSGDNGVWRVKYSDGTLAQLQANQQTLVANYQSRLITGGAQSATLRFTDVGLDTNLASNSAPVDIGEGIEWISGLATFSPGDLMVFKSGAPIYLVEGDLTSYTVRQMSGAHIRGGSPVRGPDGIIYLSGGDGVYTTPDGSQVFPMSKQIKPNTIGGPMCFQGHFLMTGQAGMILDTDTGAWFKTSFVTASATTNTPIYRMVQTPGFLWSDPVVAGMTINLFTVNDGLTDSRAESYTWKSAPIRDDMGRQMEIRAVQVYARSFNGATSTVAVTVNGVTQTLACDSSGRGGLTFYFLARKEELDIQVVAASNGSGVEAPMIEVVRFAGQPGHFLRQVADVG